MIPGQFISRALLEATEVAKRGELNAAMKVALGAVHSMPRRTGTADVMSLLASIRFQLNHAFLGEVCSLEVLRYLPSLEWP